ncbi:putative reverse transcriptase domain-containing protein [Tanacetum coccineum]
MTQESIQAVIDQALLRNSTNGDGSYSLHGDNRRNVQTAHFCFYADFMKCQPLNFKVTKCLVGLTRWIEKMESVFNISGCAIENQVKFSTCTLLGAALTWWNDQIRTLGPEAYAMTWEVLKKKMTDKWIRKLRTYTERQSDNRGRLMIHQKKPMVTKQKQTLQEAECLQGYNIWKAKKKPLWGICCPKVLRNTGNTNITNTQKGNREAPKGNGCFECGAPGHFKRDCPKLKNREERECIGKLRFQCCRVYVLLDKPYESIFSDTSADRSFISTAFSSLIDIVPTLLDNSYDVELADGKIVRIDIIIRGCTLNFLDHPFHIDLMPVELGSFDIIIGMD